MNRSMPQTQNQPTPRFGLAPQTQRTLILASWAVLICCVVVGSLAPAASPVMVAVPNTLRSLPLAAVVVRLHQVVQECQE